MHRKQILFLSNTSWRLYHMCYNLLQELLHKQYSVIILAPSDYTTTLLAKMGCKVHNIAFNSQTINPICDLQLLIKYYWHFNKIKPDIILSATIKPNIYGSIAAARYNLPIITNITGLGSIFINKGVIMEIAKLLYKFSFKKVAKVFFQNSYDRDLFLKYHLITPNKVELLPGSGVDLKKFYPVQKPPNDQKIIFLLIARLIIDKGLREYAQAAKLLLTRYPNIEFRIIGDIACDNSAAIPRKEIKSWISDKIVTILEFSEDIREQIKQADCIVLPSYREGTANVLLEAGAMAKPLIATDVPGCNNIVQDKYNGFLCQAKDFTSLADAMEKFLKLNASARNKMGQNSYLRVIQNFDEQIVITKYITTIAKIIG